MICQFDIFVNIFLSGQIKSIDLVNIYDIICDMITVIDTDVLVAGLMSSGGASFQILQMIPDNKLNYLLSVPLFLEYEDVLKRTDFLKKTALNRQDIDIVLDNIAAHCIQTNIYFLWRPKLRDPKDDMILELAVSGNADVIVTFNVKDFIHVKKEFDIDVITPSLFLTLLRGVK